MLRRLKDKTFGKGHVARILCERSFAGAQDDSGAVRMTGWQVRVAGNTRCKSVMLSGAKHLYIRIVMRCFRVKDPSLALRMTVWRLGWHLSVKDPSLALRMTEWAVRMIE